MILFNFIQRVMGNADSCHITEISSSAVKNWKFLLNENSFSLYKDGKEHKGVLLSSFQPQKSFLIFKISNLEEATRVFNILSYKLQVLASSCDPISVDKLQKICNTIKEYKTFECAHIACFLGFSDLLNKTNIVTSINAVDESTGKSPLHVAIEREQINAVQELLFLNVQLNCIDNFGKTIFHYAARCNNNNILKILASKDSRLINNIDYAGETALHEACLNNKPDNVDMLMRWKADPRVTQSARYPMHCAIVKGSDGCVKALNRWNSELLHIKDANGNSALHIADSREMIHSLVKMGCFLEIRNDKMQTALLSHIEKGDLHAAIELLIIGADAAARDAEGNGALHLAVKQGRIDLLKLLIVFGADVNLCNNAKVSPRHEVACSDGKHKELILNHLHVTGAVRCSNSKKNCSDGCKYDGTDDGKESTLAGANDKNDRVIDEMFENSAFKAALIRSESLFQFEDHERHRRKPGSRVLCLDGGGIRGLVTIKILMTLEHITGRPIRESFDWIGGTSTGGILTMGLLQGKSLAHMMGSYFRLKDKVFKGSRPYNSEPLEDFLKSELGEWTRMTDIKKPKVMLMTVLADRMPAELFIFKNYLLPGVQHNPLPSKFKIYKPIPQPQDQLVWQAVRASGAAPTYFRASGRFIDGGIIANNPTLDVLTEFHKFNVASKAAGHQEETESLHVVVSLGTGKVPQRFVEDCDVFWPEGILDYTKAIRGFKNFGELLVDQATQSEGQSMERAAAWCNMIDVPLFRFNPQLSQDTGLNCTDDAELIDMLWETQLYLQDNHDKFIQLANLLNS